MDLQKIFLDVFSTAKVFTLMKSEDKTSISSSLVTLELELDYREERLNGYLYRNSLRDDFINLDLIYKDLNMLPFTFDGLTEIQVENYFKYHGYVIDFFLEKWFVGDFQQWDYYLGLMSQQNGCSNIYELSDTKKIEVFRDLDQLIPLSNEGYLLSLISNEYLDHKWNKVYYNCGLFENVFSINCEDVGFFLELRNRVTSSIINVFLVNKNDNYGKVDLNLIISVESSLSEEVLNNINNIENEKLKLDAFLNAINFDLLIRPEKYYSSAKEKEMRLIRKYS